jgi:hypothetical protein
MMPDDAPRMDMTPIRVPECADCGDLLPAGSRYRCPLCVQAAERAVRAKLGGTVLPSRIAEERKKG